MPAVGRRLLADFVYLLTGHGFVRLVSFVAALYVTKALGPAEFGTLSLGLALAVVFGVCANLGMDDLLMRQIARDPDSAASLLGDAVVIKLLALPIGALGAAGLSLARPQDGPLYLFLFVYATLYSNVVLVCAVCRGHRRMALQSLFLGAHIVCIAVATAVAARLTGRAAPVAAGYALAATCAMGAGFVVLRRLHALPRCGWHPARWRAVLRTTLPITATLIGLLVFDRLSLVTVTAVLGIPAAGWFGAVYNVVLGLATVPGLAIVAVFPVLSRIASERPGDGQATADVVTPLLLFVAGSGVVLAGALTLLAPLLVPRLFGTAYLPSVPILQILAFGLPGLFLVLSLTSILEATDRQHVGAAAIGAGLLVAVPLCVVATYRWGVVGAAVAYDLSYTSLALLTLVLVGRALGWRHLWAAARHLARLRLPATRPAALPS